MLPLFDNNIVKTATIVEVPCEGEVSLLLALPDGSAGLEELEEKLNGETLREALSKMRPRKIDLKVPVFNHRSGNP